MTKSPPTVAWKDHSEFDGGVKLNAQMPSHALEVKQIFHVSQSSVVVNARIAPT